MKLGDYITTFDSAPAEWEPVWIIENMWQDRGVNFLCGPPKKSRKSSIRRYLTACAVSGHPAFDAGGPKRWQFRVRKPVERVLSFIIEDHPGMEKKAIRSILDEFGYTGTPNIDFIMPLGFHLDNPHHIAELLKLVSDGGYGLVTIDPLVEFHNADENSATEMSKVAVSLRKLSQVSCVVVIHHTAKPPIEGLTIGRRTLGENMRGSGILAGIADVTLGSAPLGKGRVKLSYEVKTPFEDEPEPVEIEINQKTWLWTAECQLTEDVVLQRVADHDGVTKDELVHLLARRKSDALHLINSMKDKGLLRFEKEKGKRSPKVFVAVPTDAQYSPFPSPSARCRDMQCPTAAGTGVLYPTVPTSSS